MDDYNYNLQESVQIQIGLFLWLYNVYTELAFSIQSVGRAIKG